MKMLSIKFALLASAFLLQGCGGSSNNPAAVTASTGVFLDSPVANITYKTIKTVNGVEEVTRENLQTNAKGEYEYTEGENVIFSIGALEFPPVKAAGTVTPLDIADTKDPNDREAVNMIRLLQTLDEDGDPENGITITQQAKNNAAPVNFDQAVADFENSAAVSTLVSSGGQTTPVTTLVSTEQAVAHFQGTLEDATDVSFNSLNGSWLLSRGEVIFHFLPGGRFLALQWEEENGFEGFEYGTYAAGEGEINFSARENNDGEALTCWKPKGTNCTGENSTVWGYSFSDEGELRVVPAGSSSEFEFDRLAATNSPIDGLWESLDGKEIVHFTQGTSSGLGNFFYVDYQAENVGDDSVFELGSYETVTSGGKTELKIHPSKTYNNTGLVCEKTDTNVCEGFTLGYSVMNQQLALIDNDSTQSDRVYFNDVFADDEAPANAGKLAAQKQYASDLAAYTNYSVKINDDIRTQIETVGAYQSSDAQGSSISTKFNVDKASTLVRVTDSDTSLQTRLTAIYKYPNTDLFIDVSVRIRYFGGSASGKYVVGTCLDANCDDEVYLEGSITGLGDYIGDHEMMVVLDDSTKEFVFTIDGKEARLPMADYTGHAKIIAAGGYTFNKADYTGTRISSDVNDVKKAGESGYLAVHVKEFKLNGEVYDNFTGGLIDDSKWVYQSRER